MIIFFQGNSFHRTMRLKLHEEMRGYHWGVW